LAQQCLSHLWQNVTPGNMYHCQKRLDISTKGVEEVIVPEEEINFIRWVSTTNPAYQ
jgi:hypothetical protein